MNEKQIKFFEILDSATHIKAMAFLLDGNDHWLAEAAGYGVDTQYIMLIQLEGPEAQYNWSKWSMGRTMREAHRYIIDHWQELDDGDVIDVEFILGEKSVPGESCREMYQI